MPGYKRKRTTKRSYKASRKAYKFARNVMRGTRSRYRYGARGRLARAIQNQLDRRVETKQISVQNDQYFNSAITGTNEFYSLIPPIVQGVGDSQRLGQKIRMKFLKIKGVVSYELATGSTNNLPIYVDMFILQDKIQRSQNNPPNSYQFLNNGSTNVTYNGDSMVAQLPVDTEEWRLIKRKRIKLSLNWGPGSSSTSIVDPTTPLFRTFTIKLPVYNKVIDYESTGATLPQNTNFWLAAGFFQYTNSTQLVAPVRINYMTTLYYKDD